MRVEFFLYKIKNGDLPTIMSKSPLTQIPAGFSPPSFSNIC